MPIGCNRRQLLLRHIKQHASQIIAYILNRHCKLRFMNQIDKTIATDGQWRDIFGITQTRIIFAR